MRRRVHMRGWPTLLRSMFALSCLLTVVVAAAEDFVDDFEAAAVAPARWQVDTKGPCVIEVDDGQARDGRRSLHFKAGGGGRCEVVPRVFKGFLSRYLHEPFGEDRWYAFSTWLDGPWVEGSKNEIIAQWHGNADKFLGDVGSRGPPLAIRIYGDQFRITHGWDASFVSERKWIARLPLWTGPVVTDRWLDWKIRARWSYEDDGVLQLWLNGELIVDHAGPNTYNDLRGVYLKLGPYHPGPPRSMRLDRVHIGGTEPPS
jgi:hypothetical protein